MLSWFCIRVTRADWELAGEWSRLVVVICRQCFKQEGVWSGSSNGKPQRSATWTIFAFCLQSLEQPSKIWSPYCRPTLGRWYRDETLDLLKWFSTDGQSGQWQFSGERSFAESLVLEGIGDVTTLWNCQNRHILRNSNSRVDILSKLALGKGKGRYDSVIQLTLSQPSVFVTECMSTGRKKPRYLWSRHKPRYAQDQRQLKYM